MTAPAAAHVLDNPVWNALTSRHEQFADGDGLARRYRPDTSVFGGLAHDGAEAWAALGRLLGPGGRTVLVSPSAIEAPAGWRKLFEGRGDQMVFDSPVPELDRPPGFRALTDDDVPAMVELVALTKPGPFTAGTIALGGYLGVFDDDRLIAMAGQRVQVPGYTEISAVCTHPDAQRRGLGAVMTMAVAHDIAARGDTPILHVAEGNDNARRVYERLGFRSRIKAWFVAISSPRDEAH